MISISGSILLLASLTCVLGDSVDRAARHGAVLKMLREMVNQTQADTLNLPANATSIRENITDTFSCENRTYGYYADVDNDCQIFHVCLTSQGARGRNTTYRWSFICPAETVFNQEVLVCTRSYESIPCEDSPSYYDLNMEIGKVAPENEAEKMEETNQNTPPPNKNAERVPVKNQRKPLNRKKQNIIVEELMKDAMEEMETLNEDIVESQEPYDIDETDLRDNNEVNVVSLDKMILDDKMIEPSDIAPVVVEASDEKTTTHFNDRDETVTNLRLAAERSLKRKGRKLRGSIKYNNVSQ